MPSTIHFFVGKLLRFDFSGSNWKTLVFFSGIYLNTNIFWILHIYRFKIKYKKSLIKIHLFKLFLIISTIYAVYLYVDYRANI